MAEIKIKVGVSVDQSMKTAFKPLVTAAQEARKQILREFSQVPREITQALAGLGRAQGQTYRGTTSEAQAAFRAQVAAAREAAREQSQLARRAEREMLQEHRQSLRERQALDRAAASLDRQRSAAMYREYVQNERSARRELESFARRTSHRATRFLAPELPIMSLAGRAISGALHGYGIDPTFAGAVHRNVELESVSGAISNQSRLGGTEISRDTIEKRVREVSGKYGLDRMKTAEALRHFVDRGGDVNTGMGILDKLAERSIVTSTDINDLAQLGADASMHMGNVPNKIQKVTDVMDAYGVQGDRGSIAMRQIARQSPKLLAAAMRFGGNPEENQIMMGALAQVARMSGGAANAAQAATSVTSFANTLEKPARLKKFKQYGVEVYNPDNTLRRADDIIKDAIRATGADPRKMNDMFADTRSKSVVNAFMNAYRGAGGGDKGFSAIDEMLNRLTKGTKISPEEAQKALDEFASRTSTKAAKFQAVLDDVAANVQAQLLPALEKAEPTIIKLAEALGSVTKWALENPGKAITYAIVASIARAGLESALRAGIENLIFRAAGGMGMGGTGTAGGGLPTGAIGRAAGVAMTGLALGIPLYEAIKNGGESTIDENMKDIDSSARETAWFRKRAEDPHGTSPADKEKARRNVLDREEQLKSLKANRWSGWQGFLDSGGYMGIHGNLFGRDEQIRQVEADLKVKRHALETMEATKYIGPDEVSRWRAKDSHTTVGDMQAAMKRGGTAELEKIAVQVGKQENTAQQMVEQQKNGNALLQQILDKVKAPGGGNSPEVPTDSPNFEP